MKLHFVTFGQIHVHKVNGKTLDKDTVAMFFAENAEDGREKAVKYFGQDFFTDYHDKVWNKEDLKYFSKGYVFLKENKVSVSVRDISTI